MSDSGKRLDQMLARMDIISVNCPHTPATYHLLSARRLKLMQPHAVIVNTSRGEVIDENALTRMLDKGELAGAYFQVANMGALEEIHIDEFLGAIGRVISSSRTTATERSLVYKKHA